MTPDKIKQAREIIERADNPCYAERAFHIEALIGWPEALDEVERLQAANWKLLEEMHQLYNMQEEVIKLQAVAKTAERALMTHMISCDMYDCAACDLLSALRAWRGE